MATRTWRGANGTNGQNWSRGQNWQGGIAPGTGDSVIINSATHPPILDANTASLNSLTLNSGALLNVNGKTLTVTGTSTINGGGKLFGSGVVVGPITGAGTIDATGGLLNLGGNLTGGLNLQVDSTASSVLSLGGTVSTSTSFTYLNTGNVFSGTLLLQNSTAVTSFGTNGVISGMHVGSGLTPTDVLDLRSISSSSIVSADIAGGNKIELWGDTGHTNLLASFNLNGTYGAGTFVDWQSDGSGGSNVFLSDVVCFAAGTRILTAEGEKPVESLQTGDAVMTLVAEQTEAHPIKWMGRRRIDLTTHPRPETVAPIRIRQGAFADNMPQRDLLVSPDHALFVDGKLIAARQLVNGATIAQEKGWKSVEYFHVELARHAILLAEGLPAESYLDTGNRGFFANSGEPLVLHPDLTREDDNADRAAASCAPFVWDEPDVRPVWQRLADRAAALGQDAPEHPTTTEPGLHLLAKGRRIRPIYAEAGLFIFSLPRGAAEVQLASRAAAPADTRPWLDDRRPLGVNVARIVLRNAEDLVEMPVDHPGLTDGWWTVERYGPALRRWTNGAARLPLPPLDGPAMLEIRLGGEMIYPVEEAEQPHRQVA